MTTNSTSVINVIRAIDSFKKLEEFLMKWNLINNGENENDAVFGDISKDQIKKLTADKTCQRKIVIELLTVYSKEKLYNDRSCSFDLLFQAISHFSASVVFLGTMEEAFTHHDSTATKGINTKHSNFQIVAANFLCDFIKTGKLKEMILGQCLHLPLHVIKGKPVYSPAVNMQWDHLIKTLVGLPDIISNKLKLNTNSVFLPSNYFVAVVDGIIYTLRQVHDKLQNSQDCSLGFTSQLLAKICSRGYSDILYDQLLPSMLVWTKESPLWRRICSKLILSVNDNSLEAVLEPLIKRRESLDLLPLLLDDEVVKRAKLKFLMTHKLLLIKSFTDEQVPYNVLNYLAVNPSREKLFKEVLFKLLKVWGDHGSMNSISFEQHVYLSKCILMALSLLTKQQKTQWKEELTMHLLHAVQPHLESANEKLRQIGMLVAECITRVIDGHGKQLDFELEKTEDFEFLYSLATDPLTAIRNQIHSLHSSTDKFEDVLRDTQIMTSILELTEKNFVILRSKREQSQHQSCESSAENPKEIPVKSGDAKNQQQQSTASQHTDDYSKEELDSDDELEPINVKNGVEHDDDNDGSVNGVQPPKYLRDCISGLLSSKDPNRLEACLNVVEKLVSKEPGDLNDVAVELLRILLHLDDQYDINSFYKLRMNSMVAVTTKCPVKASDYLCEQFFAENYSINQRLDLLEVISTSVTSLSSPEKDDPGQFRKHLPLPTFPSLQQHAESEKTPEWQIIVDERVRKKTKRFVSGKKVVIASNENRLSQVIGSFFFPLLKKFGLNFNVSQLLATEAMLLGKYIYTLAIVMKNADGLLIATSMGKTLLDFIWSIRYQKEAFVRQALLFAFSKVVLHVPPFVLMNEFQREIFEAKEWLQELVQKDPDDECQKLAVSCYMLLEKTLQEELLGKT